MTFGEYKQSLHKTFSLFTKYRLYIIFLAMFVFVLSPPFDDTIEYYYAYKLEFENEMFVIKDALSSLADLSAVFFMFFMTFKFSKCKVFLNYTAHLLTIFLLYIVLADEYLESTKLDTLVTYLFTFLFDFSYQLIYFTLLSILTVFSIERVEGSIVSIIDFVLGGGYQASYLIARKLIKSFDIGVHNDFKNMGGLVVIHVLIKIVSLFIFFCYTAPKNINIKALVGRRDDIGMKIGMDLIGLPEHPGYGSMIELDDTKISDARVSIREFKRVSRREFWSNR